MSAAPAVTTVVGVDGCRSGWVAAAWAPDTGETYVTILPEFSALLRMFRSAAVIAVDVPIGLLDAAEASGRLCDREARRLLGAARARSVFSPPVRPVIAFGDSYRRALAANRASSPFGIGLSKQCFHIIPKIAEVDACLTRAKQRRVREVHPEVCFAVMNGGTPPFHAKKTAAGFEERAQLLAMNGLEEACDSAESLASGGCAKDDVLDAFAACWTAARIVRGAAVRLPKSPPRDARGLLMEMWA